MSTTLLLADRESMSLGFLERHLRRDGFEILAGTGQRPDLVLAGDVTELDRWCGEAPVIVLGSPEAALDERVLAFRRGCDDYVAKPFYYEELVARIRAVLRRSGAPEARGVVEGVLEIDERSRFVSVRGIPLKLCHKEFALLAKLASDPTRVFTKGELLRDIWGYAASSRTRTLDSHASRLRRKLRALDPATPYVDNQWGVGYRLVGPFPER
jgi:DNA-binding response OmpR family regulator